MDGSTMYIEKLQIVLRSTRTFRSHREPDMKAPKKDAQIDVVSWVKRIVLAPLPQVLAKRAASETPRVFAISRMRSVGSAAFSLASSN